MVIVTLQREDCIGCNYCSEVAPSWFGMDDDDGKSILFDSTEKAGFFTMKTHDPDAYDECKYAEETCPVNIIDAREV